MNASWCASSCPWAWGANLEHRVSKLDPKFPVLVRSDSGRRTNDSRCCVPSCWRCANKLAAAMFQQRGARGASEPGRAFAKLKGLQAGFCSRGSCSLLTGMLEIAYCTVTVEFSKLLCVQRRTLRTFKFVEGVSCQGPSGPGTRQLPPSHTPRSLNCACRVTTLGW